MSDDFGKFAMGMEELDDGMDSLPEDELISAQDLSDDEIDEIDPSHKIIIDIDIKADVSGYKYQVVGQLIFLADLENLLDSDDVDIDDLSMGADDMDRHLSKMNKNNKKLSAPKTVGYLDDYDLDEFVLLGDDGKQVEISLNENASITFVKQDGSLLLNFEGVFSYPKNKKKLHYLPLSAEKMQENIIFDINFLDEDIDFEWEEDNGVEVSGSVIIKEL